MFFFVLTLLCSGSGVTYCTAVFDSYLCWPPTEAGTTAGQNCPPVRLSDTNKQAYRRCGETGLWLGKKANETSATGWTNYTPCFPLEVQELFDKVYEHEIDGLTKLNIAQWTRYLEIFGYSLSLIALLASLFIFWYFRSLRNKRTRIHNSLYASMTVDVFIRLILYTDQAATRGSKEDHRGIDNMPYLCETFYVLLENATTSMFLWMLIEGLYLHNVVTANALRDRNRHFLYNMAGWGIPIVITSIWATMTALHYKDETVNTCWYGYNFSSLYWIIQGPRLSVILLNLLFLLNIMRVVIMKLRQTQNTEIEKVRKAVRAALVLLPLLGITNVLNMTEAPLGGSVWKFALWSFTTHFFRSFQGFFIALIYCFMNGEVRAVLKKHFQTRMMMRMDTRRRRELEKRKRRRGQDDEQEIPMTTVRWWRRPFRSSDESEPRPETRRVTFGTVIFDGQTCETQFREETDPRTDMDNM